MTEAAKEARRAYKRNWQRAHREKIKEYQRRYWEKKAQAAAAADPEDPGTATDHKVDSESTCTDTEKRNKMQRS